MSEIVNEFYVYIYLDPRKPGIYEYGDYKFDYEPFYVGKGKGYRLYEHLYCRDKYNNYKTNKIKSIYKENLEPIILKVHDNLEESKAYELEIDLINLIGRHISKNGLLTNILNETLFNFQSGKTYKEIYGDQRCKIELDKRLPNLKKQAIENAIRFKDKIFSSEHKNKISNSLKEKYSKGTIKPPFKNKNHSIESKEKIGLINSVKQKGEKNSQYGTCWIYNLNLKQNKKRKKENLNYWQQQNWEQGRKIFNCNG